MGLIPARTPHRPVPVSIQGVGVGSRIAPAPIRFFANQRLIGGLEGQLPLRALIAEATRGLVDEYHVILVQGGTVVFFSMATSFSAAALGAEGLAADVTMLIGNGYVPGHAELALGLIRSMPSVRKLFEQRVAS